MQRFKRNNDKNQREMTAVRPCVIFYPLVKAYICFSVKTKVVL